MRVTTPAEIKNRADDSTTPKSTTTDILQEITGEGIDDFLKPNYVSQQEDEWWNKKWNLLKNKNSVLLTIPTNFALEKKKYLESVYNKHEKVINFEDLKIVI